MLSSLLTAEAVAKPNVHSVETAPRAPLPEHPLRGRIPERSEPRKRWLCLWPGDMSAAVAGRPPYRVLQLPRHSSLSSNTSQTRFGLLLFTFSTREIYRSASRRFHPPLSRTPRILPKPPRRNQAQHCSENSGFKVRPSFRNFLNTSLCQNRRAGINQRNSPMSSSGVRAANPASPSTSSARAFFSRCSSMTRSSTVSAVMSR